MVSLFTPLNSVKKNPPPVFTNRLFCQYVRSLHADEDAPQIPYRQTQFGVVLMVDVVGKLTLITLVNNYLCNKKKLSTPKSLNVLYIFAGFSTVCIFHGSIILPLCADQQ